jgi:serralysin
MCYACLARNEVTSWASFGHETGEWTPNETFWGASGGTPISISNDYRAAVFAASMAAGEPFFAGAYDWISNNVSGAPLGTFSVLQYVYPGGRLGNVKYHTPTGLDHDVLALFSGSQWGIDTIRYGFPDSRSDYQWINPSASGYKPLSFNNEQAARHILEGWSPNGGGPRMGITSVEGITNLSFDYAGRGGADIQISGFNPGSIINRSHAYYPGVAGYGGDTWIRSEADLPGGAGYFGMLHELGHALGLKHPHDSGGRVPKMSAAHDSPEYTVMSYGTFYDRPQTFMQYDVAALQAMYGADFTQNGGNTVYRWTPGSGETFVNGRGQGATAKNKIILTIWDGGGIDTYDFSAYSENAVIDLAPGGTSRFSTAQLAQKSSSEYAKGNVYNALQYTGDLRSLIENAIGGSGHDRIDGNTANNTLTGGSGNDTVNGGTGHDKVLGGLGNDSVRGGEGYDALYGEAGSDWIAGESGNDVVEGGDGDDIVGGQDGNDTVYGGNGNDQVWGGGGHDTMRGGDGSDALYGEAGEDWIAGEGGNDFVDGSNGNDIVGGQDGNDTVHGGSGYDQVWGGGGNDVMRGGEDQDWLYGEAGDDWIAGESGSDAVEGNDGNDIVGGQDGNDTVAGGVGNDEMWGGAGRDLFVFNTALNGLYNVDQVKDFNVAEDQIRLDRAIFSGFGATVSFTKGPAAAASGAQVIYNGITGELFYDADGVGQAAQQIKFAVLSAGLALTSANFVL